MENLVPTDGCIWVASFDIGRKNFAFCIEEINVSKLNSIENIPTKNRYHKNGTLQDTFNEIINEICMNGRIILLQHTSLMDNVDSSKHLDPKIMINLTNYLDSFKEYWICCSTFIIEQQMGFGKKQNTMALKIGQHCFSYFLFQFAGFKQIIEFPSYNKTKILGAPKKQTKHARKMWSVDEALRILMERDDMDMWNCITSKKKRDDVADTITQLQAWKYLYFVDKK